MMDYREKDLGRMVDELLLFFGKAEELHQDIDFIMDIFVEHINSSGAGEVSNAFRLMQIFHFCRAIATRRMAQSEPPKAKPLPTQRPYYYAHLDNPIMLN